MLFQYWSSAYGASPTLGQIIKGLYKEQYKYLNGGFRNVESEGLHFESNSYHFHLLRTASLNDEHIGQE